MSAQGHRKYNADLGKELVLTRKAHRLISLDAASLRGGSRLLFNSDISFLPLIFFFNCYSPYEDYAILHLFFL